MAKKLKIITEMYWVWGITIENKDGEKRVIEVTLPHTCSSEAYVMYCVYREEGLIPEGFDITNDKESVKKLRVRVIDREIS